MASANPGSSAGLRFEDRVEMDGAGGIAAETTRMTPLIARNIWWAARRLDPSKLEGCLHGMPAEEIACIFEHGLSVV